MFALKYSVYASYLLANCEIMQQDTNQFLIDDDDEEPVNLYCLFFRFPAIKILIVVIEQETWIQLTIIESIYLVINSLIFIETLASPLKIPQLKIISIKRKFLVPATQLSPKEQI